MSESAYPPSVEERLRSSLVLCAILRPLTQLADHPLANVPGFSPNEILKLVPGIADAIATHTDAIKHALPASCQNVGAPDAGGGK